MPHAPDYDGHLINVYGIPKRALLEALLQDASIIYEGMDNLPPSINMDIAWDAYEMAKLLNQGLWDVCGRVLHIDISPHYITPKAYGSYNGEGSCVSIVAKLRELYPLDSHEKSGEMSGLSSSG
ncbi:hypothetical protein BDV26DRAFT_294894 [Aspergillus bertholletiae]|uniref:Uncharacterized protein n=1 Tax=Aspergillus bertholletiae TaxID=1226010 RepID=A0A5N7B2N4_9EURO|nr:hypothetical protein BDV26DRAFT_294894 [Aspergillus bertholletiae]